MIFFKLVIMLLSMFHFNFFEFLYEIKPQKVFRENAIFFLIDW